MNLCENVPRYPFVIRYIYANKYRYTYEDEKREALEKWGSYLESLVLLNDMN